MSPRIALLLTMALGCGPVIPSDDTGDGSGADDTGTDTGDSAGTATTAGTTATTTTAGTTATTTAGTTVEPTGCPADYVTGCQSYCAAVVTCGLDDGSYEDCVTGCIGGLAEESAECQQVMCEGLTCYGLLDCASIENGSPECEAAIEKADEVCEGGGSKCLIGAGSDGSCEYVCGGEIEQRLSCELGTCTCYENDVPYASCPTDGLCEMLDAVEDYAAACCGW